MTKARDGSASFRRMPITLSANEATALAEYGKPERTPTASRSVHEKLACVAKLGGG
jgi:hypothetical protein